jgi:hypothetical protein
VNEPSRPPGPDQQDQPDAVAPQSRAAPTDALSRALDVLERHDPTLAATLSRLTAAVADAAARDRELAASLHQALSVTQNSSVGESTGRRRAGGRAGGRGSTATGVRRPGRRAPGPLDPFEVYAERGEDGLRAALRELELEQLRDIVAEHGMDHDRLAMKWKDPARVIDRVMDKVAARTAKGSAFRR